MDAEFANLSTPTKKDRLTQILADCMMDEISLGLQPSEPGDVYTRLSQAVSQIIACPFPKQKHTTPERRPSTDSEESEYQRSDTSTEPTQEVEKETNKLSEPEYPKLTQEQLGLCKTFENNIDASINMAATFQAKRAKSESSTDDESPQSKRFKSDKAQCQEAIEYQVQKLREKLAEREVPGPKAYSLNPQSVFHPTKVLQHAVASARRTFYTKKFAGAETVLIECFDREAKSLISVSVNNHLLAYIEAFRKITY